MARDLARYLQPPTRREKAMRAKLAAEPNVKALKLLRSDPRFKIVRFNDDLINVAVSARTSLLSNSLQIHDVSKEDYIALGSLIERVAGPTW